MSISNQRELQVSLSKLAVLEGDIHQLVAAETNVAKRRAMEITLSRLINQFKEEIGRYQAGIRGDENAQRALRNEQQAKNTRRKLNSLESLIAKADPVELSSLRRMRNQLKEELLVYEAKTRQLTTHQA